MNSNTNGALIVAALLSACGGSTTSSEPANEISSEPLVQTRTCEGIRSDVVSVAASNGVNIVKIYNPKTLKKEIDKIVCSGRALVSSGQEATIYYRDFKDPDGDWLIQYSETRLD